MNAYELAMAFTNSPQAFKSEMERRRADLTRRIAAAAARVHNLTPEQHAVYYAAVKDLPPSLPSRRKGFMEPVPIDEIGMAAVEAMK